MADQTCRTCRWAQWTMTRATAHQKPHIDRWGPARCVYPVQQIKLPASYGRVLSGNGAISANVPYTDCPTWAPVET